MQLKIFHDFGDDRRVFFFFYRTASAIEGQHLERVLAINECELAVVQKKTQAADNNWIRQSFFLGWKWNHR
jgi:hypothetical protein